MRWIITILVLLLVLFVGRNVLYFHYHCSEASTPAVLRGVKTLEKSQLAALDDAQFLMRMADQGQRPDGSIDLPVHQHLKTLGWEFQERMGAGLHYRRGDEHISGLLTAVGRDYWLVTFFNDLETGQARPRPRPFNLFALHL